MQKAVLAQWKEGPRLERWFDFTTDEVLPYLAQLGTQIILAEQLATSSKSGRRATFWYTEPSGLRTMFWVRLKSIRDEDVRQFDGMSMNVPVSSEARRRLRWFLLDVLGLELPKPHHRNVFRKSHEALHYPVFLRNSLEPWYSQLLDALDAFLRAVQAHKAINLALKFGRGTEPWNDWAEKHGQQPHHINQISAERTEDRSLRSVKDAVQSFLVQCGLRPLASKHRWTDLDAFSFEVKSLLLHSVVIEGERSQGEFFFTVTADSEKGTSESHAGPDLLEALRKAHVLVPGKDTLLWRTEALESGTLNTPDLSSYNMLGLPSPLLASDADFATWWSTAEGVS